ncbi:carboxymuconolactone decarboxylase family protein [Ralstonia pseudosolanacearum]|uniref:Carboxymuconolactone decarboxylase n=1 Tax=Ralstonia solanacearum TaxID=305 RepID=A0A0S4TW82_RALSL|nr:carboxymuconolactone decarboxylase [Ralstonia solanacearum]CUV14298.1 Carboxymuconolactone decarboxylase [Ralstonia solanacearum]
MTMLTASQLAIGPIAGSAAAGDITRLNGALLKGLDDGLSISDIKEVLVQLYAYAGFPRALNALGEFMKVVEYRRTKGVKDAPGREPGEVPTGKALLDAGTANQTKLSGAPVRGPLFDFAPAIDFFLKAHLFGDIFARDNLDWQSRELATVAILSSLSGLESQLLSHIRISMNVGLTAEQLKQFGDELGARGDAQASERFASALKKHLAGNKQQ